MSCVFAHFVELRCETWPNPRTKVPWCVILPHAKEGGRCSRCFKNTGTRSGFCSSVRCRFFISCRSTSGCGIMSCICRSMTGFRFGRALSCFMFCGISMCRGACSGPVSGPGMCFTGRWRRCFRVRLSVRPCLCFIRRVWIFARAQRGPAWLVRCAA